MHTQVHRNAEAINLIPKEGFQKDLCPSDVSLMRVHLSTKTRRFIGNRRRLHSIIMLYYLEWSKKEPKTFRVTPKVAVFRKHPCFMIGLEAILMLISGKHSTHAYTIRKFENIGNETGIYVTAARH